MLSPDNTEADREYVRQRNMRYNDILQFLTAIGANKYRNLFISWTDKTFTHPFTADDVSNLDCYHPSSRGQRTIAEQTWTDGPFKDAQIDPQPRSSGHRRSGAVAGAGRLRALRAA